MCSQYMGLKYSVKKLKAYVSNTENVCPRSVQEHGVPSNDTHLAISSFEHWYGTPLGEHAHGAGRQALWADHKNNIPAVPTPVELVREAGESGACQNNPFLRKSQPCSVLCEEVEDEDDFIAIRGVHWQEKDQTQYLLEEIPDSPLMDFCHFHKTNEEALPAFESDDINAESEDDDGNDEDQDLDPDPDGTTRNFSFELRKPPSVDDAHCAL
ncbi:hypothetical protein BD769DRAFT_1389414 [Suillus cothurnatus]|nr:hypothetical protein BD769DRAFT_1389414 [Suillus cothurnatus]